MEKRIHIEDLDRKTPFRVPDGYFEGLTSRVMASIGDGVEEAVDSGKTDDSKSKVVGMLPRRSKFGWVKWLAAAACVCGAVFLISYQQDANDTTDGGPTANVKANPAEIDDDGSETTQTVSSTMQAGGKVYANNTYDLSRHARRSSTPPPANIKATPVTFKPTVTTPAANVQTASVDVKPVTPVRTADKQNLAARTLRTVTPPNGVNAFSTSAPKTDMANNDDSNTDSYSQEYDLIDYANMSSSEIYDYLAGNEYY